MPLPRRNFIGYGRDYPKIAWPDGARIAISLVCNYEEGSELTPVNGDDGPEPEGDNFLAEGTARELRNESWMEYGSRVGVWRLLDVLERNNVKSTWFACGYALALNPAAGAAMVDGGHEAASHGYRWMPGAQNMSRADMELDVQNAVLSAFEACGERPQGWYSNRGLNPDTRQLLQEEGGFLYDCDAFDDDLPYFVSHVDSRKKWLVIPYNLACNDMKFWRAPGHSQPDDFYYQMKSTFDRLYREGQDHPQMMTVGLHFRFAGMPSKADALDRFIKYAKGFPDVWFARRIDIANWWYENYIDFPILEGPDDL